MARAYAPVMPLWEILPSVFRTAMTLSPPMCYRSPIKAKPRQVALCSPTSYRPLLISIPPGGNFSIPDLITSQLAGYEDCPV